MTTAVQPSLGALSNQLNALGLDYYGQNQSSKVYNKVNTSTAEKKRLLFDTSYEPSEDWWATNQADYVKPKPQDDPLPAGFPEQVTDSTIWDGTLLTNQPEKWLYHFTSEDIAHINQAYEHFVSLQLSNNEISTETFPLAKGSTLKEALKTTASEINHGLGFRILRGLPVDDWDRSKQIIVFAGLSSYIGGRRIKQGPKNIVHLRDITTLDADKRPAIVVKGQTSGNQVYHNDGSSGIVGLLTLGRAETGGHSQLASVGKTYNELARTRRDIVRELAKDNWTNKTFPEGKPLFFAIDGQVISSYSRRPFFGFYEADADVPPLPEAKHLALDAVHFTAAKFGFELVLEKGDLEYLNNVKVFHARNASEDSDENARHLIRIWLENKDQALPAELRETFDRLNAGEVAEWPLEAWDE